jgi:hypothetical protein
MESCRELEMRVRSTLPAALVLSGLMLAAGDDGVAATHLTRYRNERWGFCISYPSGWSKYEGVNRAGVQLTPNRHSAIVVGALPNQQSDKYPGSEMTLDEDSDSGPDGNYDDSSASPEDVQVISNMKSLLGKTPAVIRKIRYRQGGVLRIEKTMYAIHDHAVYTLMLDTRSVDEKQYQSTYDSVVRSFRFDCATK